MAKSIDEETRHRSRQDIVDGVETVFLLPPAHLGVTRV